MIAFHFGGSAPSRVPWAPPVRLFLLEPVILELERPTVLGDRPHDGVGHARRHIGLDFERDLDLRPHQPAEMRDNLVRYPADDDFSDRWSYAREDFERKLYRKRSKVKVAFVELDETIPVHGPYSEAEENLVWEDFLALLDPKERRIVVCLRSGFSNLTDVARQLGYANHPPSPERYTPPEPTA